METNKSPNVEATVGVVGMGIMGRGIAEVLMLSGYNVLAKTGKRSSFEENKAVLKKSLKRSMRRGDYTESFEDVFQRLHGANGWEDFAKCEFVIEAINEDLDKKTECLRNIAEHLPATAVLASNTSSLSITKLAAITDIPDRVIGLHFMNPAPIMTVVEVVRGFETSTKTFNSSISLIESLGKQVVISRDSPGFLLNRILIPMINEAIYTLSEGIGTIESIDKILVGAANHPMGPLQLADLIGLDTCLAILQVLHAEMADQKYRPCPLLVKYVEAGWLGRKTKKGFYDYSGSKKTPTWPIQDTPVV